MMKKLLLRTIFVLLAIHSVSAQEENTVSYGVLPTDIPTHNLVRYNRFYFNPTFSIVRENKKSINVYNKQQWVGFNDNPQTFLVSYTSNFDEKTGVSIGLYQQNEGIYKYFGGTLNYAYNLEFDRDVNLTFGMNLGFSQSGLKPNIDAADSTTLNNGIEITDPIILNYENSSVFLLSPGFNFNFNEFDAGVSVNNLVAYNISASELVTDDMAFRGHVMYTTSLERRSDKMIRGMGYANVLNMLNDNELDLRYGGNIMLDLPELGWAHTGYDSFYGVALGVGGHITPNVSVGYTFELGLGDTSNFGTTHEVQLAYNFAQDRRKARSRRTTSSEKAYQERDSEIRRLKKEIIEQNKLIRELQERGGDSLSQAQRAMSRLEQQIADAKAEEARRASEVALQREEEVKLLNRKSEEEERLAAQQRLEQEGTFIEDVDRIAAEEAAREEEARRQQEEADRIEAQRQSSQGNRRDELINTTRALLATASVNELRSQAEIIRSSSLPAVDKQNLLSELEVAIATRRSETLIEETRRLIATGTVNQLTNQLDIVRSSNLPEVDKQNLLSELEVEITTRRSRSLLEETRTLIANSAVGVNELSNQADIIRASNLPEVDKQSLLSELEVAITTRRSRSLLEETRTLIANSAVGVNELSNQADIIRASNLPEVDKQSLLSELEVAITTRRSRSLLEETRTLIANATVGVNELRNQADIIRASSLPQVDKNSLLSELEVAIATKESQSLVEETRRLIATAGVNELRNQADIIRASSLPQVDKQSLLSELEVAIATKQTEVEEEQAQQRRRLQLQQESQELITATEGVLNNEDTSVEELRRRSQLVQSNTFIPAEQKEALLTQIQENINEKEAADNRAAEEERLRQEAAEAARVAEEQRQAEQLVETTRTLISTAGVNELRNQADIIRASSLPEVDKQNLLSEIDVAIAAKQAEAQENQQREELVEATRALLASGSVNEIRSQADIIRASSLPEVDKQNLLAELETVLTQKEEEEEQQRRRLQLQQETQTLIAETRDALENESVEQLRRRSQLVQSNTFISNEEKETLLAEIEQSINDKETEQQRQQLLQATRTLIASGGVNELRDQSDVIRASSLPEADKQSLLSELQVAIATKEAEAAEAARLAEEERMRQETAEAARVAEQQRQAEEARQRQELVDATRSLMVSGTVSALRSQADVIRASQLLPETEKQSLLSDIDTAIAAKEAQEAEATVAVTNVPEPTVEETQEIEKIQEQLDNKTRISSKITKKRDSLLNNALNVDKRDFTKLLESLVNMDSEAEDAKNDLDPTSSRRLSAKNRFIKFAEVSRPEAQYATKFIPGYPEGYYLIGNVFKGGDYAEKFEGTLEDLGFNNAQVILNPENDLQYVSITNYSSKEEAAQNYLNNIGNKYFGDMWILHIAKNRVESYKSLLQEIRTIEDSVKDDTVLTENLSFIGGHSVENGYYLVTDVFKRENYFERGMERLRSQGLEPQYFRNPKDNYIYVYLKRFDTIDEAKQSLFSNVGGAYSGDLYILKVE